MSSFDDWRAWFEENAHQWNSVEDLDEALGRVELTDRELDVRAVTRLLERYPDVLDCVHPGPFKNGKRFMVWHRKEGFSTWHGTAREVAEAVIPEVTDGE